jgi:hypothetical protein
MIRTRCLFDPVSIASLAFFRLAFGLCLILHIGPHALGDSPYLETAAPASRFAYPGLAWLPQLSEDAMRFVLMAMLFSALGITLGLAYRLSAGFYALGAAYFHFADPAKFHNNHYLVVLLTVLLTMMPAHGAASIDAWLRPAIRRTTTPRWTVWMLRFQVGVPFFFSGLSKLNSEWLRGFPAIYHWKSFVLAHEWAAPLPPEIMAGLIAWTGALTDASVVPLMLWRRTRLCGFALAILFNLGNALLFSGPFFGVAMFPWIMIAGVTIFLDPDWPRRVPFLSRYGSAWSPGSVLPQAVPATPLTAGRKLTIGFLTVWVLIQALVPLRHHLYPGHPLWTEAGHRHAWQMMSSYKVGTILFHVTDPATGESWIRHGFGPIGGRRYLVFQVSPALIYQYANHLKRTMADHGRPDCEVRVEALVSLNGRSPQRLIDPAVDITAAPPRWGYHPWVLPLAEKLPPLRDAGRFFLNRREGIPSGSD